MERARCIESTTIQVPVSTGPELPSGPSAQMDSDAGDADEQSMVLCRLLEVDTGLGVRTAIAFLKTDPPLLFRLTIVDKLGEVTRQPFPYDIGQPFTAPSNQEAVKDLKILVELE